MRTIYLERNALNKVRVTSGYDYYLFIFTKNNFEHSLVLNADECAGITVVEFTDGVDVTLDILGTWNLDVYGQEDYSNVDPDNATFIYTLSAKLIANTQGKVSILQSITGDELMSFIRNENINYPVYSNIDTFVDYIESTLNIQSTLTIETLTTSTTLNGDLGNYDQYYFIYSGASDIVITIDSDAFSDNGVLMYFEQASTGKITIVNGTGFSVLKPNAAGLTETSSTYDVIAVMKQTSTTIKVI